MKGNLEKFIGYFLTVLLLPLQMVGNIPLSGFNEPSGIVFHSQLKTLFVVGDEGDICEIYPDGTLIKQKRIRNADFEGITYNPSTGLLYIAIEGEEKILEVDPDNFEILREFTIERTFNGKTVLKSGGNGIEGITFVPDKHHPEGGTFYVANQSFDLTDMEDPSAIFEIEVPLKSNSAVNSTAKIIRSFFPGIIDISGLCYDESSGYLYAISDMTDTLFKMTKDGEILKVYNLPGINQEGITIDTEGFLYIAQDSGGVIKIKWNRH
ncbi:MAG: SdiA-regulated domain-containing protein [bacterium]|nr:SdiA-regulated domain-containing protein [bacterium]